ncbi:response regulator transcription factor [Ruminococcaceae bacterium OttesenSCG-928-L11]|nr:response regulator transcription factor [Ruminococcaceae bacterium OttesenSCG-928-L11]
MDLQTILIVEDDQTLRESLCGALSDADYHVFAASGAKEALSLVGAAPDLVLLDLNLPDGSGFALCQTIKQRHEIPVIFLTARDDEADIVKGLDMGGDDYIPKPFRLPVLLSRIRAVLRRGRTGEQGDVLTCGCIRLIRSRTEVYAGDSPLQLTAGEYRLLLTLMEHKNQTLTRTRLLERLWDEGGNFVNDNTLTVTMKRLREKLAEVPSAERMIKTVRGIGYKLVEVENDEA